jgi:hypothetical protein
MMKICKYFSVCVNFNANFKSSAKRDWPCMAIKKAAALKGKSGTNLKCLNISVMFLDACCEMYGWS